MAIEKTAAGAADLLHLRDERKEAFARLSLYHLRQSLRATDTHGSPVHLDEATVSFMRQYGTTIWPGYHTRRGHLTRDSTVTAGPQGGLLYAKASLLTRVPLRAWKKAHGGREPTEEEQLLGSKIGKALRAYFACLIEAADEGGDCSEDQSGDDEKELLNAVVCEDPASVSEEEKVRSSLYGLSVEDDSKASCGM